MATRLNRLKPASNSGQPGNEEYLRLWIALTQTKHAMDKVRQKEIRRLGVSPEQSGILRAIKTSNSNPTPSDLSRALYKDRTSICLILKKMEGKGLITKKPDPKRKNVLRISLTDKGEQIYRETVRTTRIYEILSNLSREQFQNMSDCLKLIFEKANLELEP